MGYNEDVNVTPRYSCYLGAWCDRRRLLNYDGSKFHCMREEHCHVDQGKD